MTHCHLLFNLAGLHFFSYLMNNCISTMNSSISANVFCRHRLFIANNDTCIRYDSQQVDVLFTLCRYTLLLKEANYIPPYPKETTGWIVLKFGIHIGSDSVLTWLTFQGRRSKVKVTASENDVIFSTFLNFHFLSNFPPKPSWGGHSNTPQQECPPVTLLSVRPSVRL